MILYHFSNSEYGLDNIKNRRLKVSRIMELNDPFEFLGIERSNPWLRKALDKEKKDMSRDRGILCLSNTWQNPVLWAHYADRHRGVCLGFEVPENFLGKFLEKIRYAETPLVAPASQNEWDINFMTELMHTKFMHWKYEDEYRMWVDLKYQKKIDGFHYVSFSESQLKLTCVIIGARSSITRSQVNDSLDNLAGSVKTFKSRASFKLFKMVENKNSKLWS